jgi:hypothetical protein
MSDNGWYPLGVWPERVCYRYDPEDRDKCDMTVLCSDGRRVHVGLVDLADPRSVRPFAERLAALVGLPLSAVLDGLQLLRSGAKRRRGRARR